MSTFALSGCAIAPPPPRMCNFVRYPLAVEREANGRAVVARAAAGAPAASFGEVIERAVLDPESGAGTVATTASGGPSDASMLFLSGGSLHGAFGAGYLAAWQQGASRRLPDFRLVTGISTGAILATFAFLNRPEVAVRGYSIVDERELLKPLVPVKGGEPTVLGYLKLLRRGAIADLAPLRGRLRSFIDDQVLTAVAAEAARGRNLLVGVVDVASGEGVALDLTKMAQTYLGAADDKKDFFRDCYVEAVVASSSAPMAALPVFIDNRMYVDGGARFGMFADEVALQLERDALLRSRRERPLTTARPRFYLIINGDQEISAKCYKADPKNCANGDPIDNIQGAHAKWRFDKLALRSEAILANQVYRFSADRVQRRAKDFGYDFESAKIDRAALSGHSYTLPPDNDGDGAVGAGDLKPAGTKTCAQWRDEDRAQDDPIQFLPRYMRCVISYGNVVANTDKWWLPRPAQ